MNIYADDFVGFPTMETKTSAIATTMADFEAAKGTPSNETVSHDHYVIACTPNTATITHRNVIQVPRGSSGGPETYYSRSVHFLEKRGGTWQAVSNAGGPLDDQTTLWYLDKDWTNAIRNRDKAWFESSFAPAFGSVSSLTGEIMNRSQDIADTVNSKDTLDVVQSTDTSIRIDGDTAIVNGIFHTKGRDEKGVAFDRRSRYTDTWIKRNGRWHPLATAGTVIP
jgi:ketosteroid isomerase-like protein